MPVHQTGNPTVQCGVVRDNTALCHHFFDISQAQGIVQIAADTLSNNISRIVQAMQSFSDQRHGQAAT
ncbi:hypothetical protein CH644_23980 [Salmonella enterica subsp. enterica serovar Kentucky]|nr:hypothetical protein CH644_23980 [Salmonella enterica subsp. enterica serovar Kentucky]